MSGEQHVEVVGQQPPIMEWLLPMVDQVTGGVTRGWTSEVMELGTPAAPEVRLELRQPSTGAHLLVTASSPRRRGVFTPDAPIKVAVRVRSGRPGRVQSQLVAAIRKQSNQQGLGVGGSSPTVTRRHPSPGGEGFARLGRHRRGIAALVIAVLVVTVVWWRLDAADSTATDARPADPTSSGSVTPTRVATATAPTSAAPGAAEEKPKVVVVKGIKPQGAVACEVTFVSDKTPRRSAVGNTETTSCGFAEEVRKAYIASGQAGTTVSFDDVWSPRMGEYFPIICTGTKTITCTNETRALLYLY